MKRLILAAGLILAGLLPAAAQTFTQTPGSAIGSTCLGCPTIATVGRTATTNPTVRSDGQYNVPMLDPRGVQIVKENAPSALDWNVRLDTPASTTPAAIKAAAGAGLRNCLTAAQIFNSAGVLGFLLIQDGATNLVALQVPAGPSSVIVNFPTPVCTSANTALNYTQTQAQGFSTNFQGFVAP